MSKRKKFFKILSSALIIVLCFFLSFTTFGCTGYYSTGSSSGSGGGSSSRPGSGGSGSGGSGSGGSGSGSGGSSTPSQPSAPVVNDVNDVYMGSIGVYDLDPDDDAFYDKFLEDEVSYNFVFERQAFVTASLIGGLLGVVYNSGSSSSGLVIGKESAGLFSDYYYGGDEEAILAVSKIGTLSLYFGKYPNTMENWDCDGTALGSLEELRKVMVYFLVKPIDIDERKAESKIVLYQSSDVNYDRNLINSVPSMDEILQDFDEHEEDFDVSNVATTGISRKYLWSIAYFLAYRYIGAEKFDASCKAQNTENAETDYKAYEVVIPEVCEALQYLYLIANGGKRTINYNSTDTKTVAQNTLFPSITCEEYIYYDTVELLCDADNGMIYDQIDEDGEDMYEGSLKRLKKILLIPKIDTEKYTGTEFGFAGILLAMEAYEDTFQVGVKVNAIDNAGHSEICNAVINDNSKNIVDKKRVIVDDTFDIESEDECDAVDIEAPLVSKFSTAVTSSGESVEDVISNSFTSDKMNVTYYESVRLKLFPRLTRQFEIGVMNLYNSLFFNGAYNFTKSFIEIELNYSDENGSALDSVPEAYLMLFTPYD